MKYLLSICLLLIFSCNSADNDTDQNLPDPLKENPVTDAIPEDMKIKNDSVVVPVDSLMDTTHTKDTMKDTMK